MFCFLLLVSSCLAGRNRKLPDPVTMEIIQGPLHALTSELTTSWETMSASMTTSPTPTPTPKVSYNTLTKPFRTEAPVTRRVFTADHVQFEIPHAPQTADYNFNYSSTTPFSPPTSSKPPDLIQTTVDADLPNLTNQPGPLVTDQLTTNFSTTTTNTPDPATTLQPGLKTDPGSTKPVPMTPKQVSSTTKLGYNFTKQPEENGTDDNSTWRLCSTCSVARPLGYLIGCLVVLGLVINSFSFLHFLRRVPGVAGLMYSVLTLLDAVVLLCLVPVVVSYISYQSTPPVPLRYSKVWMYCWSFSYRFNLYLVALVAVRGAAGAQLRPLPMPVTVVLIACGGVVLLILSLLPLLLSPSYSQDLFFLMFRVDVSFDLLYDVLLGLLLLVTVVGAAVSLCTNRRRYALVSKGDEKNGKSSGKEGDDRDNKVVVNKDSTPDDPTSHRLYTFSFSLVNVLFKFPVLLLHMAGRYTGHQTLTPLFGAALAAFALSAAVLNSLIYLIASICSNSRERTTRMDNGKSQEQTV